MSLEPSMTCKFSLQGDKFVGWNPKLSQELVQQWAQELKARLGRRKSLEPATATPNPKKTQQWLCEEGQSRGILGLCLHSMDHTVILKRTIQAISGSFPTLCNLHRWGIKGTDTCPLGRCTEPETLAHHGISSAGARAPSWPE